MFSKVAAAAASARSRTGAARPFCGTPRLRSSSVALRGAALRLAVSANRSVELMSRLKPASSVVHTSATAATTGNSDHCVRDRRPVTWSRQSLMRPHAVLRHTRTCLLYTSDAADDLLCVDLGGRRII